ncbi:MAG: hypothetical protein EOP00_10135 [Pedobacter sp.]|nr:MAG: hypothetical protein EOP00_10135 [Pedobacter sp.]
MERLKLLLTIMLFFSLLSVGIYFYVREGEIERQHNFEMVQQNYDYAKGIITKISAYKGHSIQIKYSINNIEYTYKGGYDNNHQGLGLGDTIKIKYPIDSPQFIISELDNNYKSF